MTNRIWSMITRDRYYLFEAYILTKLISIGLYAFALNLLIQDKVCVNLYDKSSEFCQRINEKDYAADESLTKDAILALSAQFNTYNTLIQALPMLLWSTFIGSVLDKYKGATKWIFIVGNIGDFAVVFYYLLCSHFFHLSPYLLPASNVVIFFTGGMISFLTAANRYIILNTDEDHRPIKFVIFQFTLFVAFALGTLIGGHSVILLKIDNGPQLRNYHVGFLIAIGLNVASLVFLFLLNWVVRKNPITEPTKTVKEVDLENVEDVAYKKASIEIDVNQNPIVEKGNNNDSIIRGLFDWGNVKDTVHCLLRKRPRHQRAQIFILNGIILIFFFVAFGIIAIFLQFTEKVYHWDSQTYSTVSTIGNVTPNILLFFLSYLLITKLKISDGTLMVCCIPFGILNYGLIGTFLNPIVYLANIPINAVAQLPSIVAKNKLSKIIAKDEVGKIFGLISSMEAIIPFLGSFVFTQIFSASVSTYPGLIYQVCSAFNLLALILAIIVEVCYK